MAAYADLPGDHPGREAVGSTAYDVNDVVGARGLRHRQRRAPGLQRAHRGAQPGARQRHRAVDEAGSRGAEPGRRRRRGRDLLRCTTATGPPCRSRALQAHADRLLGWTELDGVGYVVAELSPYEADLDWDDLTEPDELRDVLHHLGRATAKAHCVATPTATRARGGPDRGRDPRRAIGDDGTRSSPTSSRSATPTPTGPRRPPPVRRGVPGRRHPRGGSHHKELGRPIG